MVADKKVEEVKQEKDEIEIISKEDKKGELKQSQIKTNEVIVVEGYMEGKGDPLR